MSKKNESQKCSQEVRNIPLEKFRLPSDGRKWQQAARSRKAFLQHLSSYANGDGTFMRNGRNYSPSLKTLLKDFARGSYTRNTEALRTVGLLSWTRENRYDRRVYTVHPPAESISTLGAESVSRFDGEAQEQYPDSQNQYPDSPKSVSTMTPNPSLPSKEPSKERAENQTATPSFSKPKTSGQDKTMRSEADAQSLLSDIKKTALSASGNLAKFYRKDSDAIIQVLRDNPQYGRDLILLVVRLMIQDMPDAFALSKAGADIAEMLIPRLEQRVEYLDEQARAERVADAWLAVAKQKSDARLAEIRKDRATPLPTAEELFGAVAPKTSEELVEA